MPVVVLEVSLPLLINRELKADCVHVGEYKLNTVFRLLTTNKVDVMICKL